MPLGLEATAEFSSCIEESIDRKLQESPFLGVMIDESTDISTPKNLNVYIRLWDNGQVSTHFIKNLEVQDATGHGIYLEVKNLLQRKSITMLKCTGLSTDGARAMTGRENGFVAYMRKDNPYLIDIHCIAHRLALASSQAANNIPYLQKYKWFVISIYSYFSHSASRQTRLKELEQVLQDPVLKYRPLYEVRWLSMFQAVHAIRINLSSLLTFESEWAEFSDPRARGILEEVTRFLFLATTHLLEDVLDVLKRLSKVFQKESVDFSIVPPLVESAICTIDGMKTTPGPLLKSFFDEVTTAEGLATTFRGHAMKTVEQEQRQFQNMVDKFVDSVVCNQRARFPNVDLISAMSILDPSNLPLRVIYTTMEKRNSVCFCSTLVP